MAASAYAAVVVYQDDTMEGWGEFQFAHGNMPSLTNVKEVVAGQFGFMAIHNDGSATTLGAMSPTSNAGSHDYKAVSGVGTQVDLKSDGTVFGQGGYLSNIPSHLKSPGNPVVLMRSNPKNGAHSVGMVHQGNYSVWGSSYAGSAPRYTL